MSVSVARIFVKSAAPAPTMNKRSVIGVNKKIVRVLGKRGRITIPYEIRVRNKIGYNDILSFEEQDKNTIIVIPTLKHCRISSVGRATHS